MKLLIKKRVIFIRVDPLTIDRKQALPWFYTWENIVHRGLSLAENEQREMIKSKRVD